MAAQAKMLSSWIHIANPSRSTRDVLNLTVGGTIMLNQEAVNAVAGRLMGVTVRVMDSDTADDDLLLTDTSFQIGVHDTSPRPFILSVLVPASKLNNCEPFYESRAEIYCKVSARSGTVQTNAANTSTVSVAID